MPMNRALITLLRQLGESLELMESFSADDMGLLWPGLLARRRRAVVTLRRHLVRRDPQRSGPERPERADLPDLIQHDAALLAQFDATLAFAALPPETRRILRQLRSEVEQARFAMTALLARRGGAAPPP